MAKVSGPLLSMSASGKIGDSMVFFALGHCDQAVVRQWLKPSNPKSEAQGDVRLKLIAAGKLIATIEDGSTLQTQIAAATPAGKIWNAYFVETVVGPAAATINASLIAWDTAANSADWTSNASSLGIADQDVTYASIAPITKGEILFLGGRAAYALGLAIAPAAAQSMSKAQVDAFGAACVAP